MKDILGKALLDYQNGHYSEDIITSTNISDDDTLPLPYLFRGFDDMPALEKKALKLTHGRVLDIGCGAGSHSLYLQEQGINVKSIDVSKGAIDVCRLRGLKNSKVLDILDETETFDTILLLMNGTGIFKTLNQVSLYLKHLKMLLNDHGQILIDSSDILYMYEDEDGGIWQNTNANYYGELEYFLSYKGEQEMPMSWLYMDFTTLETAALANGLRCDLVQKGEHFDFLARLSSID